MNMSVLWESHPSEIGFSWSERPVFKVTAKQVWLEEFSGWMINPDGTYEGIGKRTLLKLDRAKLEQDGYERRGWTTFYTEAGRDEYQRPTREGSDV